jgi:hypothetical protein
MACSGTVLPFFYKNKTISILWIRPKNGRQQTAQARARVDATRKEEDNKTESQKWQREEWKKDCTWIEKNGD